MNGEWNMKSLIRKGYEILDERAIFRYHKDKQKLELDNGDMDNDFDIELNNKITEKKERK